MAPQECDLEANVMKMLSDAAERLHGTTGHNASQAALIATLATDIHDEPDYSDGGT
jgi:hypothetical protein